MFKYFMLFMLAFECSAADFLTGTSKWSVMHPDQVASTTQALTKLGALIAAYRCGTSDEDEKDSRCKDAEAAADAIKNFGVGKINFEDVLYAVSTNGDQLPSGASTVASYIERNNKNYSGRSLGSIMVDVGPMLLYAWGE
ncbi:hypothetical protein [Pseudomonas fluorescens]|uniref:hypothetical protein n=1 Tax=Pseudomonas fluorescens TaxID=294 RepID=UPI0012403A81|nr:hypothetical protein [Pseudomonas fluorescens]